MQISTDIYGISTYKDDNFEMKVSPDGTTSISFYTASNHTYNHKQSIDRFGGSKLMDIIKEFIPSRIDTPHYGWNFGVDFGSPGSPTGSPAPFTFTLNFASFNKKYHKLYQE